LCAATEARAQEADPEKELARGAELASQEKFKEAVTVWLQVHKDLKGEARSKADKYLGVAFKRMGMLPESWYYLTLYLDASGKEDTMAGGLLEEVEATLKESFVKVSVACVPADAQLVLSTSAPSDIELALPCPVGWWFMPGKHRVHAQRPEYVSKDEVIDVRERGDSGSREILLTAISDGTGGAAGGGVAGYGGTAGGAGTGLDGSGRTAGGDGAGTSGDGPTTVAQPLGTEGPSRTAEWTLIGSGAAMTVAGAIFYGLAYSKNENLHDKYLDSDDYPDPVEAKASYDDARGEQVEPKETASYILLGVGSAALVAGVVTWVINDGGTGSTRRDGGIETSRSSGFLVSPFATPDAAGALFSTQW